jgi:hypothetical protein
MAVACRQCVVPTANIKRRRITSNQVESSQAKSSRTVAVEMLRVEGGEEGVAQGGGGGEGGGGGGGGGGGRGVDEQLDEAQVVSVPAKCGRGGARREIGEVDGESTRGQGMVFVRREGGSSGGGRWWWRGQVGSSRACDEGAYKRRDDSPRSRAQRDVYNVLEGRGAHLHHTHEHTAQ